MHDDDFRTLIRVERVQEVTSRRGGKAHFEGAPTKHDVLKVDIFLISKQEIRESTDTYLVFVMVRS